MRFASSIFFVFLFSFSRGDFINSEVSQTIYADSHIVRIDSEIVVDLPSNTLGVYHYPIDSDVYNHLAFIEAKVGLDLGVIIFTGRLKNFADRQIHR